MGLITVKHENILNVTEAVDKTDFEGLYMKEINATYSDVFKGLGYMEGKLHVEVDERVTLEIMPPRRVPLSLKDRLKQELTRLEKEHVIIKEEEPTDWVSSLVVTEKPNGKLRVCIYPQHLNRTLKKNHYQLPVIEDILPELTDVKLFSKADLKDGFLKIQLDEESSKLTTFQTPWGQICPSLTPIRCKRISISVTKCPLALLANFNIAPASEYRQFMLQSDPQTLLFK